MAMAGTKTALGVEATPCKYRVRWKETSPGKEAVQDSAVRS